MEIKEKEIDWDSESTLVTKTYYKCKWMDKEPKRYSKLSENELEKAYSGIEGALIAYNLIMQKAPERYKTFFIKPQVGKGQLGKYLESRLLLTAYVISIYNRDRLPPTFLDSLWYEKLKNREYYDGLMIFMQAPRKFKDDLYCFLIKNQPVMPKR